MAERVFSLREVCELVTTDEGGEEYVFPGSDDELDALELGFDDPPSLDLDAAAAADTDQPMDCEASHLSPLFVPCAVGEEQGTV